MIREESWEFSRQYFEMAVDNCLGQWVEVVSVGVSVSVVVGVVLVVVSVGGVGGG